MLPAKFANSCCLSSGEPQGVFPLVWAPSGGKPFEVLRALAAAALYAGAGDGEARFPHAGARLDITHQYRQEKHT